MVTLMCDHTMVTLMCDQSPNTANAQLIRKKQKNVREKGSLDLQKRE